MLGQALVQGARNAGLLGRTDFLALAVRPPERMLALAEDAPTNDVPTDDEPVGPEEAPTPPQVPPKLGELYRVTYERLAEATDSKGLRERAAALLDDADYQRLLIESSAEVPWLILELLAAADPAAAPLPFQNLLPADLAHAAHGAFATYISILVALVRRPDVAAQLTASPPQPGHLLDPLVDRRIPRILRRALYERELTGLYLLAAMGAAFSDREVPPQWWVRALYEGFVVGQRAWFDFASVNFGLPVPDELRERNDWLAEFAKHEQTREAAEAARRSFLEGGRQPVLVYREGDS